MSFVNLFVVSFLTFSASAFAEEVPESSPLAVLTEYYEKRSEEVLAAKKAAEGMILAAEGRCNDSKNNYYSGLRQAEQSGVSLSLIKAEIAHFTAAASAPSTSAISSPLATLSAMQKKLEAAVAVADKEIAAAKATAVAAGKELAAARGKSEALGAELTRIESEIERIERLRSPAEFVGLIGGRGIQIGSGVIGARGNFNLDAVPPPLPAEFAACGFETE